LYLPYGTTIVGAMAVSEKYFLKMIAAGLISFFQRSNFP